MVLFSRTNFITSSSLYIPIPLSLKDCNTTQEIKQALEIKKMSELRDITGPSKRKAREENLPDALRKFSPFKKVRPDDEPTPPGGAPHEKWPCPKPRFSYLLIASEEGHNLPRTLNQQEVFDVHNTPYTMKLSQRVNRHIKLFDTGWIRFIEDHHLKAGDEISFDKNFDTTISDDFYYILRFAKKPKSSKKPSDDAKSSKKLGDGAESSKKPSDDAERSNNVPGLEMPMFKVIYHRVLLETPPSQEQIYVCMPGSRPFQLEAICLSKTLTEADVESLLYFDAYDAIVLTDNPRFAGICPGVTSKYFIVFGGDNRLYKMKLNRQMRDGLIDFCLHDWGVFVRNHDLRKGDRVAFYKFLDRNISENYYYVVLKLPADVYHRNRRNPVRPGSRALSSESHCFSKTISQKEVFRVNSGLQLEAFQARHFVSNSRSLNELFMVFDESDRQYDMKLSYFFDTERRLMCCFLDRAVWHSFVKNNNLRAGHKVHVYKILDQSVCNDHYFVIKHTVS